MSKHSIITTRFLLAAFLAIIATAAQAQITMTGSVKTDKGVALVGAYINVEGTNIATLTDLDGNYTLVVPEKYADNDIHINYAGYTTATTKVNSGTFDIILRDKEAQRIEELTVSTQKRLQSSIEVPIALSVIDSAKIRQTGLYRIDEMSDFVPGFTSYIRSDNNIVYGIRGVSSSEEESYGQSRISVYMNGVSISRLQSAFMELYDMERVEVVKGPQGTLFGRGAELGAVHYITKKPTDEFSASIAASYGNYNQRKAVAVLNTPIGKAVSNRLAMSYNAHDGFIKNEAGGTLNGKNTIALRNSTKFHLGDKFDLNMVIDYEHDDTPGVSYQCKTQFSSNGDLLTTDKSPFTTAALSKGGSDLYVKRNLSGFMGQLDWDLNENFDIVSTTGLRVHDTKESYDLDGTRLGILDGIDICKGYQVSEELRCNWSIGKKLTGFFGGSYFYENVEHSYVFYGDLRYIFPPAIGKNLQTSLASLPEEIISNIQNLVNIWAVPVKKDHPEYAEDIDKLCESFNELAAQRIRAQVSTQFEKWFGSSVWTRTPDFFNDTKETITNVLIETMSDMATEYPLINQLLIQDGQDMQGVMQELNIGDGLKKLAPVSNIELPADHMEDETDYNRTYEASVFADFCWNIYKRLYLTVGIRANYETLKTGYYSSSNIAPILGSIIYANTNGQTYWTEKDYKSAVWRAVVNWMPNPTHNLYLSASRGRRPGMVYYNFRPDEIINLSPETTTSYELGMKGRSKYGHISYELAFYYFDWKNFQSLVAGRGASESGALTYISDDKGKAYGAGAEISAVYTFNPNTSIFTDFAYNGGTFKDKDMNGNEQSTKGNIFAITPRYTFNIGFNWKHELSKGRTIYFYPSFYTRSKTYFNDNNTEAYKQSAYIILNANAGYTWTKGRITYDVGIYGRNITNTKYLTDAGNGGEVVGLPTYEVGAPATVNLSLRLLFK